MQTLLLTETNFSKLKELVKKNKDNNLIFSSSDDELNRKVMEKLKVQGILIPLEERKDYLKQRNSGFNEVMAKIAKKEKIDIYIDFDEILNSKNKERIFSRIIQNIELCNRNKIQIKFYLNKTKRTDSELKSLLASLGAPTWMTKNCTPLH